MGMSATPYADKLTIIEAFADHELPVRMFHLHVLLEVRQFVYPPLGERHQEHVECHASHCIVLRLYIRVLPLGGLLVGLVLTPLELARVRQWL